MRLPFFSSSPKPETRDTIKTPQPTNKLAATQRITIPVPASARLNKPAIVSTPATVPAPTATPAPVNGPTVPVKIASIASQIPSQVYTAAGQALIPAAVAKVPVSVVLPQLPTGKISIKLSDLLTYFPAGMLRSPLPPHPETQAVILPLEEIIPALPADALNTSNETEVSLDDPEFKNLPTLINDEMVAAQRKQAANPVALADTQPLRRVGGGDDPFKGIKNEPAVAPAPKPAPAPAPKTPIAVVVPTRPRNDLPESIVISLKALISALPESVLNCSRAEAEAKTSSQDPILLPAEQIIPQLRNGGARLPVSLIVSLLPRHILADQMPPLDNLLAPLPLAEIIPQLSPAVFTDHQREAPAQQAIDDLEIPDPFQEKNAPKAPEPVAETIEVEETALNDDNFNIFSEKSAPVEPVAAAPVVVPEPEPVVVPEPIVEPVAAAPVVVPEPEPVIEQVVVPPPAPVVEPAYADADMSDGEEAELPPVTPSADANAPVDERKALVDLNRCTAEDLMTIPGIGRALAQRVIDFRNARGHFASLEELRQVPGIGRKTFRALVGVQARALNRLLGADHDGELTLQEIVRLTGKLPGIQGCMLALSDGLFLTGQLPAHLDQNTISVFAPQLFKKVGRYARELKVGQIRRFTIFTEAEPISIFKAGDVYVIIVHDTQRYSKALLRRCERISQEIARLSSQRVTV